MLCNERNSRAGEGETMQTIKQFWRTFCSQEISHRSSRYTLDGIFVIAKFNPLIQWLIGYGIVEIGTRNHYAVGIMRGRFGAWSRIRKCSAMIGGWTVYVNLGECEPYNPITGKAW